MARLLGDRVSRWCEMCDNPDTEWVYSHCKCQRICMDCGTIYHQSIDGFCSVGKNCDCGPCLCVDPSLVHLGDPSSAQSDPMIVEHTTSAVGLPKVDAVETKIPTAYFDTDSTPNLPSETALDRHIVAPLPPLPTDPLPPAPTIIYQPFTPEVPSEVVVTTPAVAAVAAMTTHAVTMSSPVTATPPVQPTMGTSTRDYSNDPLVLATRRYMNNRCQPFDLYKFCGITK